MISLYGHDFLMLRDVPILQCQPYCLLSFPLPTDMADSADVKPKIVKDEKVEDAGNTITIRVRDQV
jgi:hypothetical protein